MLPHARQQRWNLATCQAIGMQGEEQDPARVGASEAGLEKMNERYFQLAKSDGFNLHKVVRSRISGLTRLGRNAGLKGRST